MDDHESARRQFFGKGFSHSDHIVMVILSPPSFRRRIAFAFRDFICFPGMGMINQHARQFLLRDSLHNTLRRLIQHSHDQRRTSALSVCRPARKHRCCRKQHQYASCPVFPHSSALLPPMSL